VHLVFPNLEALPSYLANVHELGKSMRVPSCALRLVRSRGFEPELVYWDDGSVVSYMTVAAVDPKMGVMVNGAVLQYGGFAVCEVPGVF
jgi:arylesterase/paraoxonase